MSEMDIVRRDELDLVREMAAKARAENEELKARIAALEARLAGGAGSAS
jgi:BMFP domain-containing protein YqiC